MQRLKTWHLFAISVLIWGTTWHAITYQVGLVAPEVGVSLRFGLAGLIVLGFCAMRAQPLRFAPRDHAMFALQGAFMYGVSYICVYHAEQHVPSGLVAVGYSASPLVSGLGAMLLFGVSVTRGFVLGGLLGLAGVALIFWPEFAKAVGSEQTALGAVFTVASVLLSAVGSLTASRNRERRLPFWPALGYGMVYGALTSGLIALAQGRSFALPMVASWWVSLLYLSLAGSVVAFACFLTLQDRLGPGPTGTIGVMTPVLALFVSLLFESYRPDWLSAGGVALAVLGNVLMLRKRGLRQAQPERDLEDQRRGGNGMNSVSPGTFSKR
jgi:drug/metabolite transporter (DMT)-like permease